MALYSLFCAIKKLAHLRHVAPVVSGHVVLGVRGLDYELATVDECMVCIDLLAVHQLPKFFHEVG